MENVFVAFQERLLLAGGFVKMEIKTTNEIADIWDNTLELDINKTMRTKWVRVDDVETWLDKKSPELLHDFIIELSKGEQDGN